MVIERTAQAHCAPFTGENYLFRLTREGEVAPLYTAMLSVGTFTPDSPIWNRVMQGRGGQMLTVTLERAVFLMGDIVEGPFAPTEIITLTVGP